MIEVEQKFLLTAEQIERLTKGAEFLGEKIVQDTYYDSLRYSLTTANIWFRQRDGKFELKLPLTPESETTVRTYRELTTDDEIRKELLLTDNRPMDDAANGNGYFPFASFQTVRRSFSRDPFRIDLDVATFDDPPFMYAIAEIELLVEHETQVPEAINRIVAFAKTNDLTIQPGLLGKLPAYLKAHRPDHYAALLRAGVVQQN